MNRILGKTLNNILKNVLKKMLVVCIAVGILSGHAAGTASAQEVDSYGLEWMKEDLYEGVWFPITEAGTKLFLPNNFLEYPEKEDPENGLLYVFEGTVQNKPFSLEISYQSAENLNGEITPDKFLDMLSDDSTVQDVTKAQFNGYECVTYDVKTEDGLNTVLAFFGAKGGMFCITASPYNDSTRETISNIFFSFSEK